MGGWEGGEVGWLGFCWWLPMLAACHASPSCCPPCPTALLCQASARGLQCYSGVSVVLHGVTWCYMLPQGPVA
jgi:hypothetical protein